MFAGAGNDTVVMDGSAAWNWKVVFFGEEGADVLVGGQLGDVLDGGAGHDWLLGLAGDDQLRGAAGPDGRPLDRCLVTPRVGGRRAVRTTPMPKFAKRQSPFTATRRRRVALPDRIGPIDF